MAAKLLAVDPPKCTGCNDCELACLKKHESAGRPAFSRIRIIQGGNGSRFYLPVTCQHCEDPPCLTVCPEKAIIRESVLNGVMIRADLCIGCQMCVSACPLGAMGFDPDRGLAYKCDLCEGDPECVKVCEAGAIGYVEGHRLHQSRIRKSAKKHYRVVRNLLS